MGVVSNLVLDQGGSNEVTVYIRKVEKVITKLLVSFTPPRSSVNWSSGPNTTRIVDLLRIEKRFVVTGYVDEADKDKISNVIDAGGVVVMSWDGDTPSVCIEKASVEKNVNEDDHRDVMFTCIVGEDM